VKNNNTRGIIARAYNGRFARMTMPVSNGNEVGLGSDADVAAVAESPVTREPVSAEVSEEKAANPNPE
jgi:hypothetical protein